MSTTPNGDLLCISSFFSSSKTLYFYGLKENGRPYFLENGKETPFRTTDSEQARNEGAIFGIKLSKESNDDKEYIIGFANNNANFEIYDFDNNIIYKESCKTIFGTSRNSFQYASIFRLNTDEQNYYIISIPAHNSSNKKLFYLMKFYFSNLQISTYPPTKIGITTESAETKISSCFESENNYIFCFYLDTNNNYIINVYNYDLQIIGTTSFSSTYYGDSTFFKCIHFTEDAGAFLYYDTDKNIAIQFKNYINGELYDYFNSNPKIKINNNNYMNQTKITDMIKLADKKFCIALISSNNEELNLFVVNNYVDEKIKIRHYNIKIYNLYLFKIKDELSLSLYNGFIAMASAVIYDGSRLTGSLIIFNYPNSTDFSIDITDNLISFINPIIKLNEKCKIENNIFGYIFAGIKIYNFSDGLKLLIEQIQEEIEKDFILASGADIELILTNKINIEENGRIEYGMVVIEDEYDIYNQYPIEIDNNYCGGNCDDEIDNFSKQWYFGRISYCDITFNLEKITKDCDENCFLCIKGSDKNCIICNYLYEELPGGGKKCLGENEEIPQTEIIKISTTENAIITTSEIILPQTTEYEKDKLASSEIATTIFEEKISSSEIATTIFEEKNPSSEISKIKTSVLNEIETIPKNQNEIKNDGKNCTNEEIINNKCNEGKITINQIDEIKNNLLQKNYTKENIIIKTENVIMQLSTSEDQKKSDNPEVSNIDLGECENLLKIENNIPLEDSLIIFKTDIKTEDFSATYVAYEIFNPYTLQKLNLTVCQNAQKSISISIPIQLNDNVESLANSLNDFGYDLFNENDSFYNDICTTYTSINGSDMLLYDRKKDIYEVSQNQTMCQKGCIFQSYNLTNRKAKCDCSINNEIVTKLDIDDLFDERKIAKSFYNTLKNSNFQVLKCYKLIINISNILKNYGEILMSVLFIIFIILTIIYGIKGKNQIHKYIDLIIKLIKANNIKKTKSHLIQKKEGNKEKNKISIKKANKSTKGKCLKSKSKIKEKKQNEPPRKLSIFKINKKKINKKSSIIKSTDRSLTKKRINNNIFLNVQVINSSNNKKKYNKLKEKNNKLKNKKYKKIKKKLNIEKKNIYLQSNKRKILINNLNTSKNKIELKFNKDKNQKFFNLNDYEIKNLEYKNAIIFDKRTYFQYYCSLLKKKQLILFTFLPTNDYNLPYIKIALFIVSFSLYFTINGFFFSDDTMHKVYENNGAYNFLYQIPIILYSSVISTIINMILKLLSLSEKNILELKSHSNISNAIRKSNEIESCLKIKFILFFIFSFILMSFFWYFISCFSAVYSNTQIILIEDTLISFFISMIYPFGLNLLPGIFRMSALKAKNKNRAFLYKLSLILALI